MKDTYENLRAMQTITVFWDVLRVALVTTEVSEESSPSIIRVTKIC
jgi:hypothetical protein